MEVGFTPRRGLSGRPVMWLLVIGFAIAVAVMAYRGLTPGAADVRAGADAAAYELERTPVHGLGITIFDVQEALSVGARDGRGRSYASELRVTDAGSDDRGDVYEITNSHGDHPVCLAVRLDIGLDDLVDDQPSFPTTNVTDGRC